MTTDFLAAAFIRWQERRRALARHDAGLARVVPVLLEPCSWREAPFACIQELPGGMVPVASAPNPEVILRQIAIDLTTLVRSSRNSVATRDMLREYEMFTDAQLMKLMHNVRTSIRLIEESIAGIPVSQQPLVRLIDIEELRRRLQSYEDEFQRRASTP